MSEQQGTIEAVEKREDGSFVINTQEKPNTNLTTNQEPPAESGQDLLVNISPKEEAKPEKQAPAGFTKIDKSAPVDATPKTPEWFEAARKELGIEADSVEALKEHLKPKEQPVAPKDDYIRNAMAYYNEHGTLQPFLDAFSVKYEDMSPEQVMRHNLKRDYPNLSDKAFEQLFNEQVLKKYKQGDDFDEDDAELGKELMTVDAEKVRAKFIEEQKSFVPPPREDVEAQMQQQAKQWRDAVESHQDVRQFLAQPNLTIDIGDDSYAYGVEGAKDIVEMAVDNTKFWSLFATQKGELDMKKFIEVAAFAKDPETYKDSLIGLGRTLGTTDGMRTLKNGEMPKSTLQRPTQSTDWRESFLESALNQKKQ